MTTLILRESPFVPAAKWFHMLPAGKSVSELLREVRGVPTQVFTHGRASIGGVPIPREWWDRVRVKADSHLYVSVLPKGGGDGGGGKDLITTIGTLALIAGAAFITGGAAFGLAGAYFAAGSLSAQFLAVGFTVVGQLALNALAPPPLAPSLDTGSAVAQREIAGVTGNPLGRREYLPRVLGTMRASPPHVMWPYTELVDGEVVANALVGLAGQHSIADIQVSGAPIDDFDGVTYQTRTGAASDTQVSLFDYTSAVEQNVGETLSEFQLQTGSGSTDLLVDQTNPENSYPKYKTFKTRGLADRVDMRLFWPSGIQRQTDQRAMQPMVFQFRLAGSSTWLNGPELWWSDKNAKSTQKRQHIRLIWAEGPLGVVNPDTDTFALVAYGDTPETYQWKPESYFAPSSGYYSEAVNITDDGFEVYLDPATYPKGQYEIRLKRGLQISYSSWTLATYVWSAGPARWYDSISASAPWEATNNQDDQIGPVVVETFLTRSDDYPFTQEGLTLIAVRAIGVKVDSISALFTSIVEDWTGAAWVDGATANPASLYRHVLASSLNSKPLPASVIDDDELVDWHTRCASKGYECNAIVQNYSVDQCKQVIAAAGWALPQQSDKWGVVQERDRSAEAPVQLFTQRNTRGLTIENSFADLPHAIVAEYFDEDDDYLASEQVIYLPGYNALNATLFDSIPYDGFTSTAKVIARAGLDRDQLIYRQRKLSFEADMAHLVSPRGALVALSNDTLGRIYDAARIVSVTDDGAGNITALVLDCTVNIEAAPLDVFSVDDIFNEADIFADSATSGVTIQCHDATTLTLEIDETSDASTLTLTTPLADPGTITAGLTVAVGRLDREHLRCRIFSIERVRDLNARITVVDEAPQIHAA